jgi:glycogen debranching enzyme
VYPDGSQVKQPKALCELQGYVYAAKRGMADIYDAFGQPDRAAQLREAAEQLKQQFNAAFWMEDEGTFAFALDPDKQQVKSIASNAGQCLWSGIADEDKAARVAKRLLEPDMWSGWGIRTLSMRNPAYDPFSYQRGSVWPHDNGLIALGMRRYGLHAETQQVARAIFAAAARFQSYKLPEVFAGIARRPESFPVQYRGANIPQAWAAGSVFHLVRALLGLEADAPSKRLRVAPALPDWLPALTMRGLQVGATRVSLRCWTEGGKTRAEVIEQHGPHLDVDVLHVD